MDGRQHSLNRSLNFSHSLVNFSINHTTSTTNMPLDAINAKDAMICVLCKLVRILAKMAG